MSSVKTAPWGLDSTSAPAPVVEEWVEVRGPTAGTKPRAGGVIASLARLRQDFVEGRDTGSFDVDSASADDYGSGDPELANDIERTVEAHWDR